MCGIVGLLDPDQRFGPAALGEVVGRMAHSLRHRGPDSCGIWSDPAAGLALGHRRLAIIDLSTKGHQPMVSTGGRYCIVFNGEIYNHPRLRRELLILGVELRGHSDTEVLLTAVETWGLTAALRAVVGMFAFALWDRHTRTLTLARDHLGQKPLYFGHVGSTFAFASELKAFAAHPDFRPQVNRGALALFLRHQYVPAPHTIWRDVFKLPAGGLLSLDLAHAGPVGVNLVARIERHWCARTIAERGRSAPTGLTNGAALDCLDQLLNQAVSDCMVSDVPLGAFLSGGVDSSLLVALMQRHAARPINTFTIGFLETSFDEAGVCPSSHPPPRHGAHGTLRDFRGGADDDSSAGGHVRRAAVGSLADSNLPCGAPGAKARDRMSFGRWRRRGLRRIRALCSGRPAPPSPRRDAGSSAPRRPLRSPMRYHLQRGTSSSAWHAWRRRAACAGSGRATACTSSPR